MTNCVNCGAPIDLHRETCPYCDSPYIHIERRHTCGAEIDAFKRLSIKRAELENELLKSKIRVLEESDELKSLYGKAIEAMRKYTH